MTEKTHYRKAFHSPYLSSADIVEPITLTVSHVKLEGDKTKKTKDNFNTAYFVEKEIRPGEPLKPMILNSTNSKMMKSIVGSPFIDDWNDIRVMVYVDPNVKMMGEMVEGLRICNPPQRKTLQRGTSQWDSAIAAYVRDGNLNKVKARVDVTEEDEAEIVRLANAQVS